MATLVGRLRPKFSQFKCLLFFSSSFCFFAIYQKKCVPYWTFIMFHLNFCSFCILLSLFYYGVLGKKFLFHFTSNFSLMSYNGHFTYVNGCVCVLFLSFCYLFLFLAKIHTAKCIRTHIKCMVQSMRTEAEQRRWKQKHMNVCVYFYNCSSFGRLILMLSSLI